MRRQAGDLIPNDPNTARAQSIAQQFLIAEAPCDSLIENFKKENPEIIQKVFFLYYYLGLSIKEIAEELNITESNVKHYIYRTLSELKEALNEYNK